MGCSKHRSVLLSSSPHLPSSNFARASHVIHSENRRRPETSRESNERCFRFREGANAFISEDFDGQYQCNTHTHTHPAPILNKSIEQLRSNFFSVKLGNVNKVYEYRIGPVTKVPRSALAATAPSGNTTSHATNNAPPSLKQQTQRSPSKNTSTWKTASPSQLKASPDRKPPTNSALPHRPQTSQPTTRNSRQPPSSPLKPTAPPQSVSRNVTSSVVSGAVQAQRKPKRFPLPKGQDNSTAAEIAIKNREDAKLANRVQDGPSNPDPDDGSDFIDFDNMPNRFKRRFFFLLCESMVNGGVTVQVASDYQQLLLTVEPIKHGYVSGDWEFDFYDEDQRPNSPNLRRYRVNVKLTRVAKLGDLFGIAVTGARATSSGATASGIPGLWLTEETDRAVNYLNILFSHCPNMKTRRDVDREPIATFIGPNKFFNVDFPKANLLPGATNQPKSKQASAPPPWPVKNPQQSNNPGGIVAMPGFFRSIRANKGNSLLLNINTTTSAFYAEINDRDAIARFAADNGFSLQRFLQGLRDKTNYMRAVAGASAGHHLSSSHQANEMIFTLRGLPFEHDRPHATNNFFEVYDESSGEFREMTVAQYGKTTHNIDLDDRDSVVECGKGVYIPTKYLDILRGQNYKPTVEMIAQACHGPGENAQSITTGAMSLLGIRPAANSGPHQSFSGLTIDSNMVQVPVVNIPCAQLKYGDKSVQEKDVSQGRWNLRDLKVSVPSKSQAWTVIDLIGEDRVATERLNEFCNTVSKNLNSFGLGAFDKATWGKAGMRSQTVYNAQQLRSLLEEMVAKPHNVKLAVVLLPSKDQKVYGFVKRVGDIGLGIHTICHVKRHVEIKRNRETVDEYDGPMYDSGFLANLHMKFNLKLGDTSANQKLASNTDKILTAKTMLVGIDVTRPGATSLQGAESIAAVVGSVDTNFAQYPASLSANPRPSADSGQSNEEISVLKRMMVERLNAFQTHRNRQLPDRLIIYRDGLSEAQFKMCQTRELPQIKQAIDHVYNDQPKPSILLVCAVKRHHARLFANSPGDKESKILDRKGNSKPGVAVFQKITYGESSDFFLVSHETLQGNTRPTHYVVLHNEIPNISIEDIANTTQKLCYLFGRATRSVSLAPPAYYADLAADRARYYVRDQYVPQGRGVFNKAKFDRDLRVHDKVKNLMFYI